MNTNQERIIPKYLAFFIMLYMAGPLATILLVYKEVSFAGYVFSAASFISPIWYITSDIITEVYGFKVTRNLFWCWGPAVIIIAILLNTLIYLPSPTHWHHEAAYQFIFGHFVRTMIDSWFVMGVSNYVNTYFISRWKVALHGRYFWARSIGASLIGICLLNLMFDTGLIGTLPIHTLASMMLIGIIIKVIILIVFAGPSQIITNLLKHYEKIDVYDSTSAYNPFNNQKRPHA